MVWLPGDRLGLDFHRAPGDDFKQAVARADENPAIGPQHHGRPLTADARVDDAKKDRTRGKFGGVGGEEIAGGPGIVGRCVGEQIDDG